jgi:uridylate kinase
MTKKQTFIISLGGSLIVPQTGIDWQFLKKFRQLILAQIKKGHRFYLIAGGGSTARNYINAASKVVKVTNEDLDWLGIHTTRLNAHLLRTIFRNEAHPQIIKSPTFHIDCKEKVIVASGWRPGWSTDFVATVLAHEYDITTIINLSNIDYVYNKDPRKFKDAKKIEKISWKDFRKIVGDKWDPGMHAPFDPIASKIAQEENIEVTIMNGKDLINIENCFSGKKFKGTIIK